MTIAVLGDKFQMVIPKNVREVLGLKARDQLVVWLDGDRIEATPLRKYKDPVKVITSACKRRMKVPVEKLERELDEAIEGRA
jgi:AbrB family looped-hinge helix DNA binding protein